MFVDEVIIDVTAGSGGDGCTAFRREKYVPMGGPDGGNGGNGSNIIFKVDRGLKTLLDLRYHRIIKGERGAHGMGSTKNGKNAKDIYIKVPEGTTVTDLDTGLIVADLTKHDEEVVVAYGGRGGRGNKAFATAANPAPNISEYGEPGEKRRLKIELKLLADVGLVGLPSVGKSTLISNVSACKAKVAAYHFTTLVPNLGVVKVKDGRTFVMADLPGLIKGASLGEGLGDQFLKHIERTKVIVHIIDMGGFEGRNPYDDYMTIQKELENFNPNILKKPQIILANKMDLPDFEKNLEEFKKKVKDIPIYPISAILLEGVDDALIHIADLVYSTENAPIYDEEQMESHVLYKFKKENSYNVYKENDYYVISGEQIEKLLKMTKFNSDDAILRFARKLRKMGIDDKLEELGAKAGDRVKILDFEFEYRV